MSKSLSANISAGKAGGSEPVYLINMDLGSSTTLCLATKATTDITGWSGDHYAAGYLEDLGTIDMLMDCTKGPTVHSTYDFEFSILNQDNFHTTLLAYDFYNRAIEVRMIFADQTSPSWANAVKLFKGIIRDWAYDKNRIIIKCTSNDKKWFDLDLPNHTYNTVDYERLPSSIVGKCRPLLWGVFSNPTAAYQSGGDLAKAWLIDSKFSLYNCADHNLYASGDALFWDSGLAQACHFTEYSFSDDNPALLDLDYYWIFNWNVIRISRMGAVNPTDHDFSETVYKIQDFDDSNYIELSKATDEDEAKLILRDLKTDGATNIYVCFKVKWFAAEPAADILAIQLYSDNFATMVRSFACQEDHDYITSLTWDVTSYWQASTKINMGFWLNFADYGDDCSVRVYEILIRAENTVAGETPDWILCSPSGMEFGAWIDYGSRSNGFNEGDCIEPGSYVIESIMRLLGYDEDEIEYASFDVAGNSSTGTRKDWKLAGQLLDKKNVRALLGEMALQHGSLLFENYEGKLKIKPINFSESSGGTLTGSSINIDSESNESTLVRNLTDIDDVYNSFEVFYKLNYATNGYDGYLYCNQAGKSAGIASGYDTKCSNSSTKYSSERKLEIKANWVRDSATAIKLIEFLVDWFTNRREIIEFDTSLANVDLEIGDVRTINNTFVNDTYMLIGIKHDCSKDVIHTKWIEL